MSLFYLRPREAIEELGYGSAADAVEWLQKGGGIREVNDAWGQVMGTTGTTGMSWGTPGSVPSGGNSNSWKIPELNGGFLRKSHIDTSIDSVFSSTPCLMKLEGMHVELMGGEGETNGHLCFLGVS